MTFACWITKAINTRSEYVLLLALALNIVLQGCPSDFRYIYFDCCFDQKITPHVFYEDQEAETNAYFSKLKAVALSFDSVIITVCCDSALPGRPLNWLT